MPRPDLIRIDDIDGLRAIWHDVIVGSAFLFFPKEALIKLGAERCIKLFGNTPSGSRLFAFFGPGTTALSRKKLEVGEVFEIELLHPVTLLLAGAFVEEKPWEGFAVLLIPEALSPKIKIPVEPHPGEEIEIAIESRREHGSVYLIVKDARLPSADTPAVRLGAKIKAFAQEISQTFSQGRPKETLHDSIPEAELEAVLQSDRRKRVKESRTMMVSVDSMMSEGITTVPPTVEEKSEEADPAHSKETSREEPQVIFAKLLEIQEGRAGATLRLGKSSLDYVVDAFVLSGMDWAQVETRFRAESLPFISLSLPPFIHPEDGAIGQLQVGARGNRLRVQLHRRGGLGKLDAKVPLQVSLQRKGRAGERFLLGDEIDLLVKLSEDYKDGDLIWVCLPDALSRILGGGQVKRFSVHLEGKVEVLIPLAATSVTLDRQGREAPQRFAVCLRNMFEEERAGSPGSLLVTISPGGTTLLTRVGKVLRRWLSKG